MILANNDNEKPDYWTWTESSVCCCCCRDMGTTEIYNQMGFCVKSKEEFKKKNVSTKTRNILSLKKFSR